MRRRGDASRIKRWKGEYPLGPVPAGRGGPLFSRFLEEEPIPFIESRYLSDPEHRVLAGVSFGGLFVKDVIKREGPMRKDVETYLRRMKKK